MKKTHVRVGQSLKPDTDIAAMMHHTVTTCAPPQMSITSSMVSKLENEHCTLKAELTALKTQNKSLRASERESNKRLESLKKELEKVCLLGVIAIVIVSFSGFPITASGQVTRVYLFKM